MTTIDWDALYAAAKAAMQLAYAPYSKYPVGAAALVSDGRLISGSNIENASYGLTLCAECALLGELISGGGGRLVAFACVDGAGEKLVPCGRCRQLLFEHGAGTLVLDTPEGLRTIEEMLPQAFGPGNLTDFESKA